MRKRALVIECAESHEEHGDKAGAKAIRALAAQGQRRALAAYPEQRDAIENAAAYALQELNGGI